MIDIIKRDFPNFPDEVINDWLLPFANTRGWPPSDQNSWSGILSLHLRPLSFWTSLTWELRDIDLRSAPWSFGASQIFHGMMEAHLLNIENPFSDVTNAKVRIANALKYILQHGKFPKPICLVEVDGTYEIADGNHRFFALQCAQLLLNEINDAAINDRAPTVPEFVRNGEVVPLKLIPMLQKVWIARIS